MALSMCSILRRLPPSGSWHHIAFVWDGSFRQLYADATLVAKDDGPVHSFVPSQGGLRVGADGNVDVAGFWSGSIDEIRIYDQAVAP